MSCDPDWESIKGTITGFGIQESHRKTQGYDFYDEVLVITTDLGSWKFWAEGDCCAEAYIDKDSLPKSEEVVGQKIVKAWVGETTSISDASFSVKDTNFYYLETESDEIVVTLYVEHNGYYGGWLRLLK